MLMRQVPEEEDSDEDDYVYNPLKLPMGPDGKPIPYWLYKLHGLNQARHMACWLLTSDPGHNPSAVGIPLGSDVTAWAGCGVDHVVTVFMLHRAGVQV